MALRQMRRCYEAQLCSSFTGTVLALGSAVAQDGYEYSVFDANGDGAVDATELLIHPGPREVYLGPKAIPLPKLEFDLLLILAQHPGMVWSRERLLERVWGPDFPGITRVVDVRIAALRKKLGDESGGCPYIETVHGVGYKFRDA